MARVNGVSFNEKECLKMTKKQFVKSHEDKLFLDRPIESRRVVLGDAYDIMSGLEVNNRGVF